MEKKLNSLQDYIQKRDFTVTPEPERGLDENGPGWSFVVQKHDARNTHYDFRLELDGVLKSWAVPKGPSLDPGQKRLAVRVEDHPTAYGEFEGTIPQGQYGAGSVIVWDHGVWEPIGDPAEALKKGDLKFRLYGQKLRGKWVLVRMHNKPEERKELWLLIKERDTYVRAASEYNVLEALPDSVLKSTGSPAMPSGAKLGDMPESLTPQLATLTDRVPSSGDWSYEIKFDGYRIMARIDKGQVRLFTRNGLDWTDKLKSLAFELGALKLKSAWLDGEIVVLGENGIPDFEALQNAFDTSSTGKVLYFVFDIPFYAGFDLRTTALSERRALLAGLLPDSASGSISFSEDFGANGSDIYKSACEMGLEGVIGKRRDSPYVSGRSKNWIKLKCGRRQEFVVVGYTESKSGDRNLGALLLGYYDEQGRLVYAGRVGTGFDQRTAAMLGEKLEKLEMAESALFEKPKEAAGHWVLPELVAEVSFAEWTKDGLLRQAVFHGLRSDKLPTLITREKVTDFITEDTVMRGNTPAGRKPVTITLSDIHISNPGRIIDPSAGLTKLDLMRYYEAAAKWMLPHLKARPAALLRAPSGLNGQLFFQKHQDTLKIPGLMDFTPSFEPEHEPFMQIDTKQALLGAIQMNTVEFHTMNLRSDDVEKPDRMVFDLDPGEGLTWGALLEAADMTRTLLEELDLQCFLKTSGGKGLHIIVPLAPKDDWETVKDFSKGVSGHLAKVIPSRFSAVSGPKNRLGKVFVDYLRNNRGATTVCAFSARARQGMGVSMPITWQELPALKSSAHWNIITAQERLASGEDPWKEYFKVRQTLSASGKKLMLP